MSGLERDLVAAVRVMIRERCPDVGREVIARRLGSGKQLLELSLSSDRDWLFAELASDHTLVIQVSDLYRALACPLGIATDLISDPDAKKGGGH